MRQTNTQRLRLKRLAWHRVLSDSVGVGLWLLPTVSVTLCLAAGAMLSRMSVDADSPLWPLAFQGTAEGARGILLVLSATILTVTGMVAVVTIIARQVASWQYSPGMLPSFMHDRGTQIVLSVLLGAFTFITVGLQTVGIQRVTGAAFIPRLAVSGSLALGLTSVGVVVYFIHHLARTVQIDTIMSKIEREALWVIDDLYPDQSEYLEPDERCPDPPASAVVLPVGRSGYLQAVHPKILIRATAKDDLVVRLDKQVGDHVFEGTPLAWVWHRTSGRPVADPELLRAAMADAVSIGLEPTMSQDVAFGLRRLVDIGNKALSSAVNEPSTGIQATITSRCSCAYWPAGGSATGSTTTSEGRFVWPSHSPSSMTTFGWAPPRSGGEGPRSQKWPAASSSSSRTSPAVRQAITGGKPAAATSGCCWRTPNARSPSPPMRSRCWQTAPPRSPRWEPIAPTSRSLS
jgi:uncharacterized membrane protein